MRFCIKCGSELKDGSLFCTKCGSQIFSETESLDDQTEIIDNQTQTKNPVNTQINTAMPANKSKKYYKLLIAAVGFLLILGIAAYSYGTFVTSKDRLEDKFIEAINSSNSEEAIKYITSSDPNFKINTSDVDNIFNYLNETPSYKSEVVDSIKEQCKQINSTMSSEDINNLFTLKKQGKFAFVFDKYMFEIKPLYVNITTNYTGTEIYINNNLLCTTDEQNFSKTFGPYVPGKYTFKAMLKGSYGNLQKEMKINYIVPTDKTIVESNGAVDISLSLNGYIPKIDCYYQDAIILANDKNTGLSIKDADKLGPVPTDGSVKLCAQKNFPWGTIKSDEVVVNGQSTIKLQLSGINTEVQESLMNTLNSATKSWCIAESLRDSSRFTNFTDKLLQKEEDKVNQMIQNKSYYTGRIKKTAYDLDSIVIYLKDNVYYAELIGKETYEGAFYNQGSTPNITLDDEIWKYTLIYDSKTNQWLEDDYSETPSFNAARIKDFYF